MKNFNKGAKVICTEDISTVNGIIRKGYQGTIMEGNTPWPYVFWKKDVGGHSMNRKLPEGHCWAVNQKYLKELNFNLENK